MTDADNSRGAFVISLDFELHWGMRDKRSADDCRELMMGAREAVPAMLDLFARHEIHATWATVGMLFFESKDELLSGIPRTHPTYSNRKLNPYFDVKGLGDSEKDDPLHYAPSLIRLIGDCPGQEIGTHTFSHYYCLEDGQTDEQFRADLEAAVAIARSRGIALRSIVFPRNQVNRSHLPICRELGIVAYRGNPDSALYLERPSGEETRAVKLTRFADSLVSLTGHNCYAARYSDDLPVDVAASRFLRSKAIECRSLRGLHLNRIRSGMRYAACNGLIYHLWWHPHNVGTNRDTRLAFLDEALTEYERLRDEYGMLSCTMSEVADSVVLLETINKAASFVYAQDGRRTPNGRPPSLS